MKAMSMAGMLLVVVGVLALIYQGFSYTHRENLFDVGPIHATTDERKQIPIPPIFGGLALLAFEIFVFPGHGVSAVLGIILILGGMLMTFVGKEPTGLPGTFPSLGQSWIDLRTGMIAIIAGTPASPRATSTYGAPASSSARRTNSPRPWIVGQ